MPFVEVFAPKGTLSDVQLKAISEQLVAEVMKAEGAPDSPEARSISWLVFHEPDAWSVGGIPVASGEQPRYLVRVSVPAGSLDDAKRADMIERVTAVLDEADADIGRLRREPAAWVHLNEIPDGNWGALGRVMRLRDIAGFVNSGAA